jgi:aromatic-amino-acid transaminase
MLTQLQQQPADALLALIKLHNDDPRTDKIDLGVGVYRTGQGDTPVFTAVKQAEKILLETQDSKAYLGPEGDMGFVRALIPYVFGANDPLTADLLAAGRIDGMQAPGGTGALRLAFALAGKAGIRRFWMGTPSWPNHAQMLADLDIELKTFVHANRAGLADMDSLRFALSQAEPGDAVLLHGCCHNPTGIDYTHDQWDEIAELVAKSGVLPILDLAYQGLGHGMEADAYGVRKVLSAVPEGIVSQSCDKNFGLYRDRVGALYVMAAAKDQLPAIMSNAYGLARANWSQPPDHGGAAVRIILADAALTREWLDELDTMRARMRQVRGLLAASGRPDLAPVGTQNGLFSILPLTPDQVMAMRTRHGIYMAGSGRVNIAGLTTANIPTFIAALADVTGA